MKWVHTPIGLRSFDFIPWFMEDLTYPQLLAACCCLICLFKNFVNLVQLWKASKILVGVDLAERAKARQEKLAEKQ